MRRGHDCSEGFDEGGRVGERGVVSPRRVRARSSVMQLQFPFVRPLLSPPAAAVITLLRSTDAGTLYRGKLARCANYAKDFILITE